MKEKFSVRRKVTILSLGGTIAMTTNKRTGGVTPALSARDLLAAVPALADLSIDLKVRDVRQLPGASLTYADITALNDVIAEELSSGVDGIVVTQGTDTIEETAFLIDLLHRGQQTVVVTGAMRNPMLPGADGPANLHSAVIAAACPDLRGAGCLVVLNDEIHSAQHVQKTHSTDPGAFESSGTGPIGRVEEGRVRLATGIIQRKPITGGKGPVRHVRTALHTVTLGDDGVHLTLLEGYCDGLVIAGFGVGHVPKDLVEVLEHLARTIPVVLTSRIGNGSVLQRTYGFPGSEMDLRARGLIGGGDLHPYKAKVLLHLLLSQGYDKVSICAAFARYEK